MWQLTNRTRSPAVPSHWFEETGPAQVSGIEHLESQQWRGGKSNIVKEGRLAKRRPVEVRILGESHI